MRENMKYLIYLTIFIIGGALYGWIFWGDTPTMSPEKSSL